MLPHFCLTGAIIAEKPAALIGIIRDDRGLIEGEHYE